VDRDDIIKMAKQAGLLPIDIGPTIETWQMRRKEESLVRFAELVAAHEREACAKVCEERQEVFQKYYTKGLAAMCAEAIRARGEQ
jgi:phosphoribosyl-ATP pyrophosphohydrolase